MDVRSMLEKGRTSVATGYDSGLTAVLDRLGLESRRSAMETVLPAIGIFAAGVTVGALLGVMFAPKRGSDLRGDIRHKLDDLKDSGVERYESIRARNLDEESIES